MGRTLAIGDIHGCSRALQTLAETVGFTAGDTVVPLGDYVDRGPDSKGVIDFLIALAERCEVVPLKGNHEIMMEQARLDRASAHGWLAVGGDAALDSYGATTLDDIPAAHWEFVAACLPFYETDTHFFVHANAHPDLPLAEQPEWMLYWEPFGDPAPHFSGKVMVCGHSAQRSGLPINIGHAICLDTRAHGGGWLTCLDVGSGQYWQADQSGRTRSAAIADLLRRDG